MVDMNNFSLDRTIEEYRLRLLTVSRMDSERWGVLSFVQESREWLKGDLLLGYNSDSACSEINNVLLLIVLLSCVTRENGSWTVYGRWIVSV